MSAVDNILANEIKALRARVAALEAIELPIFATGTFSPAFGGSTTNGTISYDVQTGRWTRFGPLVICRIHINTNTVTTKPTGNLQIRSLPFTAASLTVAAGPNVISDWSNIDLTAGNSHLGARVNSGAATANITQSGDNIGASFIQGAAMTGNDVEVVLTLIYEIG